MTFGERLYELRKARNISQEELAELLDVSRQSISKWETDRAYPEMTRLLFISDYFGISLDCLIRGTENNHKTETAPAFSGTKDIVLLWNSFSSNLTAKQRRLLRLFLILLLCVMTAMVVGFFYVAGLEIGKFIWYIQNPA